MNSQDLLRRYTSAFLYSYKLLAGKNLHPIYDKNWRFALVKTEIYT